LLSVAGHEEREMTEDDDKLVFPREQWAWRELLRAALLELDSRKLPLRIKAAQEAISSRMQEMRTKAELQDERTGLQDGLSSLRVLARLSEQKDPEGK
jgi:hypothetical protein